MGVAYYPARWEVSYLGKQEASLYLTHIPRYWELSCAYQQNSVSSNRHWAIAVPAWTCVAVVFGYWFYEGCVSCCTLLTHITSPVRTENLASLQPKHAWHAAFGLLLDTARRVDIVFCQQSACSEIKCFRCAAQTSLTEEHHALARAHAPSQSSQGAHCRTCLLCRSPGICMADDKRHSPHAENLSAFH